MIISISEVNDLVAQDYSDLVKRAKNGDKIALEEIYEKCYAFVLFVCNQYCNDEEDAEEVAQDTFLQAFRKMDQLEKGESLLPWLRKIAVHKCYRKYDSVKKHSDNIVYVEDFENINSEMQELNKNFLPTDCYEDGETRQELLGVVAALPETQRKMVHLYYYIGMNTVEISRLHKCTDSYVRKTLFNARNTIKEKIHSRDMQGAKLAPLGALFIAEEVAFVTSYTAANAVAISTAAATVVGTAATQAAVTAKIATAGYVAACVLTTGIIATGVYHAVQAPNIQEFEVSYETEVAIVEPYVSQEPYYHGSYEEEVHEYEDEIIYDLGYSVQHTVQPEPELEPEPEPVYTPEPYEETPEYEPEPVIDKTLEILSALANANTNGRLTEVIRQYGFTVKFRSQSSIGEVYRFYSTNQGSGDILIGVREYEDEWDMRFRFFDGGNINMPHPDLIIWLESSI